MFGRRKEPILTLIIRHGCCYRWARAQNSSPCLKPKFARRQISSSLLAVGTHLVRHRDQLEGQSKHGYDAYMMTHRRSMNQNLAGSTHSTLLVCNQAKLYFRRRFWIQCRHPQRTFARDRAKIYPDAAYSVALKRPFADPTYIERFQLQVIHTRDSDA